MFSRSIILATVLIAVSHAEDSMSNEVPSDKRASMKGFQGMRGKKDVMSSMSNSPSNPLTSIEDDQRRNDFLNSEFFDNFLSDDLEKRASMMGFQGMRGKKSNFDPVFEDAYYNSDKRAPRGFQGTRGKKNFLEEDYEKRAPMGFQGVRGKKSLDEVLDEIEKKATMGFQGKNSLSFPYLEDYDRTALRIGDDDFPTDWRKRAPMGFHGMRGRKNSLDELLEQEKRALLGFHGVRGKRDYLKPRVLSPGMAALYNKRPMMGFHGMRGKRSTDQLYDDRDETEKRSMTDYEGFLGGDYDMQSNHRRFAKRSPYRYYGLRGKKNPRWGFRGKFVGVRGKKWAPVLNPERGNLYDYLYDNAEGIVAAPVRH